MSATVSQADLSAKLPANLRDKFTSEGRKSLLATSVAQRFQDWFEKSGLPFFPDYTDHTFQHSMDVLQTAIDFAAEESSDVITGADLSILIMACCCHDAGMHLTEGQFQTLISRDHANTRSDLDKKSWPMLWSDYQAEVRRFNEQQLIDIFGDTKPPRPLPNDIIEYSKRDKLLVGEFLRRHHPRLAHEIARGLDTILGLDRILEGLEETEADLVGLIARSHGMPLRDAMPYLETHFDPRDFQGCHAVYLMVLLRIADYAQIQSARAPKIFSRLHNIRSPVSSREWRVHQSIANINNTHNDPEAFFVDSRPKSIGDFVRVKDWLIGMQNELDVSWAVLGEVYGRHKSPPLDLLRLKIRRVRSNILENSGIKLDFVADALSFRVAETQMLGLLLAPLYGNNPLYGVRELVQNARDATLEAQQLWEGEETLSPRISIDITTLSTPPAVTITDNGVGMSFEVIRSYFLNAGASFRFSDEWRSTYETEEGKSSVSRSGRFGVGALAAFLIGDLMEVTTRHVGAPDGLGYQFGCKLQDKEIEVRRVPCEIGSKIRISTDKDRIKSLLESIDSIEELFHFRDVELTLNIDSIEDKPVSIDIKKPTVEGADAINFSTDNFPAVDVLFQGRDYYTDRVRTYVNGIGIASLRERRANFGHGVQLGVELNTPLALPSGYRRSGIEAKVNMTLYIEDPDAKVDLNLARTEVTNSDADVKKLIYKHLYALLRKELDEAIPRWMSGHVGRLEYKNYTLEPGHVLFSSGSCYINDSSLSEALNIKTYCRVNSALDSVQGISKKIDGVIFAHGAPPPSKTELVHYFRDLDTAVAAEGSAMLFLHTATLAQTLKGPGVPRWLSEGISTAEIVEKESEQYSIFGFGDISDDDRAKFESIWKSARSSSVEYFRSTGFDLSKWSRWHRYYSHSRSAISSINDDIIASLRLIDATLLN